MKYIRMHEVDAEPMTRGDYNKSRGWEIPANENPADEGYKVVYPDGYVSWCPKAQFEEAARPCEGMTFGMAIEAMKRGEKVTRKGWNGEGQFVDFRSVDVTYPEESTFRQSLAFVFHFKNRHTGETGIQVGWLASQGDMKAEDWEIVE